MKNFGFTSTSIKHKALLDYRRRRPVLNVAWGFTLIEFIIYIAIIGGMLTLITGFLWNIIFGNIKEAAFQEVQQNARFALTKINQEIKKATGINSPLPGEFPASSLSLMMADSNLDPTIFEVIDGKLRIRQGSAQPNELTSDQIIISSLQFTNLSYEDTPGTIRIELAVDYLNPEGQSFYQASINLNSTVSLVPGGATP